MSRLFDDASSQYLGAGAPAVSAYPITMACWAWSDDAAVDQTLMWIGGPAVTNAYHDLVMAGNVGGDPVQARSKSGIPAGSASSSSGFSLNTWHHVCGLFEASVKRDVRLDGGNAGINSTSVAWPSIGATAIGRASTSAPSRYMSGRIAEAAVWNVLLTDDEVVQLAKGVCPLLIRPAALVHYWPLLRTADHDLKLRVNLTAFGSPGVADHPRILRPTGPKLGRAVYKGGYRLYRGATKESVDFAFASRVGEVGPGSQITEFPHTHPTGTETDVYALVGVSPGGDETLPPDPSAYCQIEYVNGVRQSPAPAAPISLGVAPYAGGKTLFTVVLDQSLGRSPAAALRCFHDSGTGGAVNYGVQIGADVPVGGLIGIQTVQFVLPDASATFAHGTRVGWSVRSASAAGAAETNTTVVYVTVDAQGPPPVSAITLERESVAV